MHTHIGTTAFKGLLNWPDGFHAFLRTYRPRGHKKVYDGPEADLGVLYKHWYEKKWRYPVFQFVREVFEEHLVDQYASSLSVVCPRWYRGNPTQAQRFAYATVLEAAQLLHTPPAMVRRLMEIGRLVPLSPGGPFTQRNQFVRRAQVFALRREWSEALPLTEAAWWLGVSADIARDLAKADLLALAEHDPEADDCVHWRISKQSIGALLSAVMTKASVTTSPPDELIDLRAAAQMPDTIGLDAAGLIARVANGELRAHRSLLSWSALSTLLFAKPDIRACVEDTKARRSG